MVLIRSFICSNYNIYTKDKMKKFSLLILGVISLVLISGCTQKQFIKEKPVIAPLRPEVLTPREQPAPGTSAIFIKCENFALGAELEYEVTANNQAFDILRQYWYACPGNQQLVEDCILEDMTGDEAIQKEFDPSFKYTSLVLETGQEIEAWVLNYNYAVDKYGNVYGCYFE